MTGSNDDIPQLVREYNDNAGTLTASRAFLNQLPKNLRELARVIDEAEANLHVEDGSFVDVHRDIHDQ